ncbi:Phosphotransferase system IIC component, glucose/maltose/N-acetylglucosamine-specific [Streptococcus suis 05ZYH33]|nr:Phosphotransferase system IIC component, glucose/maltose/N-acetylglucosamine-specific [Streptococcus suis 05ZYH33]
MVVIAVMPAAGLMVSIRKLYSVNQPRIRTLDTYWEYHCPNRLGDYRKPSLALCLAIGGSWAKEKAGGAFSAGLPSSLLT